MLIYGRVLNKTKTNCVVIKQIKERDLLECVKKERSRCCVNVTRAQCHHLLLQLQVTPLHTCQVFAEMRQPRCTNTRWCHRAGA